MHARNWRIGLRIGQGILCLVPLCVGAFLYTVIWAPMAPLPFIVVPGVGMYACLIVGSMVSMWYAEWWRDGAGQDSGYENVAIAADPFVGNVVSNRVDSVPWWTRQASVAVERVLPDVREYGRHAVEARSGVGGAVQDVSGYRRWRMGVRVGDIDGCD